MSGNRQKTTNTTTSQPSAAAQPFLAKNMKMADDFLQQGVGFKPYTDSMVVAPSQQTRDAQMWTSRVAGEGFEAMTDNMKRLQAAAGEGGLTDLQRQSVDQLAPMAAGEMLVENNPFTEAVVDRTGERMAHRIAEMAGASGRYGSGAHQGVLAREIGDMANRAYSDDYNRERGYMQDAIGSRFNAGQQQRTNRITDADAIFNAYQQRQAPLDAIYDIGAQYEDLAARQINDRARIFGEMNNSEWDRLAAANAIQAGNGALGRTVTNTAAAPSRAQGAIGGALAGSALGPWGALGGGLLGLL